MLKEHNGALYHVSYDRKTRTLISIELYGLQGTQYQPEHLHIGQKTMDKPTLSNPVQYTQTGKKSEKTPTVGLKYSDHKPQYGLIPAGTLLPVVRVLTYGATTKYSPDNWKHVPNARTEYYNSAMRHLEAWWHGTIYDAETNEHHLAHAICCLMFLMWFDLSE